jgi:hypothetical protein
VTQKQNPHAGDARADCSEVRRPPNNTRNHHLSQTRLGGSRRLVNGRWVAASQSTQMLEAMLTALARQAPQTKTLKAPK